MNILVIILVFCAAILLLGNIQKPKKNKIPKEKETGYKSPTQYNFDTLSVYGVSNSMN